MGSVLLLSASGAQLGTTGVCLAGVTTENYRMTFGMRAKVQQKTYTEVDRKWGNSFKIYIRCMIVFG